MAFQRYTLKRSYSCFRASLLRRGEDSFKPTTAHNYPALFMVGENLRTVFSLREQASKRADTGVHRCADLFIFAAICVSLDSCRNKSICRPRQGTTLLAAIREACFLGRNLVNNPGYFFLARMVNGKLCSTTWPSTDRTRKLTVYFPGSSCLTSTASCFGSSGDTSELSRSTRLPSGSNTETDE